MGAPEPEDDALYQLEPDEEDPDEIYNDGDVEVGEGWFHAISGKVDGLEWSLH